MSNGEDEPDDAAAEAADAEETANGESTEAAGDAAGEDRIAAVTLPEDVTEESLNEYLDAVAEALETAETEVELDDVEALLDDAEEALEAADLPEPDEEDEDADDPRAELETRIEELRSDLEEARGPYAEDVVAEIESAAATVEDTRWTEQGADEVAVAVESFLDVVSERLDVGPETREPESLVGALESVAAAVAEADLDPDADAETIAALLEATDALATDLDEAEEWDDLETREQLQAQGFYDILGHYKDFPPEWSALRMHELEGNVDMVLLALDSLGSDFMEEHALQSLQNMGKRAATEEAKEKMLARADKRDKFAIRILGKMAAEEATETLLEYVDADSDPQLQKVTFKALGEIGAAEAVQPLANKLEMDNDIVRPYAARALGLVGDARAVDPLADALASDESDDVRAAAAWALRQIGTEDALEAAAEYADERVFVVQTEARKAAEALEGAARPA